MPEENELRLNIEKLADHLSALTEDDLMLEPDTVNEMLRDLLRGDSVSDIIESFGLVSSTEEEPGV